MNVAKELAALQRKTVNELQTRYGEVFGEAPRGRHKQWLIKRIIWRMQANAEGSLTERALRRAAELADDADLRVTAPKTPTAGEDATRRTVRAKVADERVPMPGAVLTREYKGQTVEVRVLADGFEYEGERYKSLSAVATAVTGSHWSGNRFFGLQKKASAK